jgi:hypothetical protein
MDEITRYSTEVYGYTPRTVAAEFAERFFAEPRQVGQFNDDNDKFALVNGISVYQVRLIPGVRFESADRYDVVQLVNSSSIK